MSEILKGHGAPTSSTVGNLNDVYMDIDTEMSYKCKNINVNERKPHGYIVISDYTIESTEYVWEAMAAPAAPVVLQDMRITENGTYSAEEGYTGLGTVTVDVASSGGGFNPLEGYTVTTVTFDWSEMGISSFTIPAGGMAGYGTAGPRIYIDTNVFNKSILFREASFDAEGFGILKDYPSVFVTLYYSGAKYGYTAVFRNNSDEDIVFTSDMESIDIYIFSSALFTVS